MYNIAIRITEETRQEGAHDIVVESTELSRNLMGEYKGKYDLDRSLFFIVDNHVVGEGWGRDFKLTEEGDKLRLYIPYTIFWGKSYLSIPRSKPEIFQLLAFEAKEAQRLSRLEQHIVTDLNKKKKMLGSYIFSGISWDKFVKAVHDTVEKTYGGKINDATDGWETDKVNLFTESHKYGYPIGEILIQYSTKGGYYDVDHDWQETGEIYKDIIILRGKNGHLMYSVGERFNKEQYSWYAGMVLDVLWQVKKENGGYLRNINGEETIREINETIAGEES